nr:hypothetical protein [Oscillospiraceae bacterium]
RTLDDVPAPGEVGGIAFDSSNRQMLISFNRGAQIIEGVQEGLYEGYDREIHEVCSYSMSED